MPACSSWHAPSSRTVPSPFEAGLAKIASYPRPPLTHGNRPQPMPFSLHRHKPLFHSSALYFTSSFTSLSTYSSVSMHFLSSTALAAGIPPGFSRPHRHHSVAIPPGAAMPRQCFACGSASLPDAESPCLFSVIRFISSRKPSTAPTIWEQEIGRAHV